MLIRLLDIYIYIDTERERERETIQFVCLFFTIRRSKTKIFISMSLDDFICSCCNAQKKINIQTRTKSLIYSRLLFKKHRKPTYKLSGTEIGDQIGDIKAHRCAHRCGVIGARLSGGAPRAVPDPIIIGA